MGSILVLHGLGGSAGSVEPVVTGLRLGGHEVTAPTLPGHGTRPEDLATTGWAAWRAAAARAAGELRAPVTVVGQSMGATLALDLAADPLDGARIAAVACINPVVLSDPDAIEHLEWQLGRGVTLGPPAVPDIRDPDAVDPAYDRLPLRALIEMSTNAAAVRLDLVAQPVLVITSLDDHVVDPASSDAVAAGVRGPVERLLLHHSGHVATLDRERDLVVAELLRWIASNVAAVGPASADAPAQR